MSSKFYTEKVLSVHHWTIEQNKRHIAVLNKLFDSDILDMPVRLGIKMKPRLRSLILVANSAQIHRPKNKRNVEHLDRIIKNEQLQKRLDKDLDQTGLQDVIGIAKIISRETLYNFAESLASLHTPLSINWKARFGIQDNLKPIESTVHEQVAENIEQAQASQKMSSSHLFCAACKKRVSETVARYCWHNKTRFSGKVYCFNCQKNIK